MINFKIRFAPESAGLFIKLHPENKKKQIKEAIQEIRKNPYAGHDLQEELIGFKSYKSQRYRILYKLNEPENFIEIYYIGHRKDVYEQFRRLLNQLT
ncbi:type II toxin-antitoxin system RelE/ParE family toxin [Thermodesulfobacteriota bacterium]